MFSSRHSLPPSLLPSPTTTLLYCLTNSSSFFQVRIFVQSYSMPRVSRFGGASKKGGNESSTSHTSSTQAPLSIKARHQAPPPSIIAPPSTEAPSQAPPAIQTRPLSRQSSKYWTVDVKDATGNTKTTHLRLKDLWVLPNGSQVVLPLNDCNQPIGEAAGLLGQALGQLGIDFAALPICYKSWSKVPFHYKEEMYNIKLKEKFILDDDLVKKTIIKRIGEKWKDNRSEVFHRFYNPNISKEENFANPPLNIDRDQWTQFIEYRLDPTTMKICRQNAQSREKQLVVHSGGSKTLSRKRNEMEVEAGQLVGRGKVFVATHTKVDGTYVNDVTKTVCEKIIHIESEGSCSQAIAPDDSLGQVLGKERSGRVRGLGLGPCPSQVFRSKRQRLDGEGSSSCSNISRMQQEIVNLRARLERETQSRLQFQNAVSILLRNVATPFMTPELAAILNPMATNANDGDVGPNSASSYANHDEFSQF